MAAVASQAEVDARQDDLDEVHRKRTIVALGVLKRPSYYVPRNGPMAAREAARRRNDEWYVATLRRQAARLGVTP